MGLQAVYERFLASPDASSLSANAALQYVTTLTTITQQGAIIKHLEHQQQNVVQKKSEKIISTVEGPTSLAAIVETTLQFVSSGGAYLPGLDSFIVDRIATLPVTHFVSFDQDDRITQVRLSWDQGDLLKQVEVIGTRGKNWPVYEGKQQIKMITTSKTTANDQDPAPKTSPRGRNNGSGVERSDSPSKKFIRDPHTSLNLYQQPEEGRNASAPNAVAPRESHKPAPREMSDIFAAGHEDYQPTNPGSPPKKVVKNDVVAPKGASHKGFQPSRLFDDENSPAPKETKLYKTNPARYNHFDIGDVDDNDHFQHRVEGGKQEYMPIRPKAGSRDHRSQWEFEDFVTPEKAKQRVRGQDVVHFSYEDEENQRANDAAAKPTQPMRGRTDNDHHFSYGNANNEPHLTAAKPPPPGNGRKNNDHHFEFQDNGTPHNQPIVHKSRKDADTHFSMADELTPAPRRIISRTQAANQLYSDPVFGLEEDERPLATISNNARKDQVSHWDMADESPANFKTGKTGQHRKGLESHWDMTDESTAPKQQTAGARGGREQQKNYWDF